MAACCQAGDVEARDVGLEYERSEESGPWDAEGLKKDRVE